MLSSTFFFVLSGCLLGLVQVAAGIGFGLWLRRSGPADRTQSRAQMRQAERIAQRLGALADDMSSCVDEHRLQIERASRQLSEKHGCFDDSFADLVTGVITDVARANQTLQSKLESAEARLQEQATEIEAHMNRAMTDALTGLPNRREFNERLQASMEAWRKRGETFSLLMLDVDHFKRLNDQYGHVAGDQILTAVAAKLRGALRADDTVARYGGEEFGILFPATPLDQAARVAHQVGQAIAAAGIDHDGRRLGITVSGGLAMILGNEEAASLVGRADTALYAAKQAGRNQMWLHNGTCCEPITERDGHMCEKSRSTSITDEPAQIAALLDMVESLLGSGHVDASVGAGGRNGATTSAKISAQLSDACEELRRTMAQRCALEGP